MGKGKILRGWGVHDNGVLPIQTIGHRLHHVFQTFVNLLVFGKIAIHQSNFFITIFSSMIFYETFKTTLINVIITLLYY